MFWNLETCDQNPIVTNTKYRELDSIIVMRGPERPGRNICTVGEDRTWVADISNEALFFDIEYNEKDKIMKIYSVTG